MRQQEMARVGKLEEDPPLALASVGLAARNPERLRRECEEISASIAAVERGVTRSERSFPDTSPGTPDPSCS